MRTKVNFISQTIMSLLPVDNSSTLKIDINVLFHLKKYPTSNLLVSILQCMFISIIYSVFKSTVIKYTRLKSNKGRHLIKCASFNKKLALLYRKKSGIELVSIEPDSFCLGTSVYNVVLIYLAAGLSENSSNQDSTPQLLKDKQIGISLFLNSLSNSGVGTLRVRLGSLERNILI